MSDVFSPWAGVAGGVLIGLAASLLLWADGQVAGISSIWGRLVKGDAGPDGWRGAFTGGLIVGALILAAFAPGVFGVPATRGLPTIAVAGVLVGVGTRMGTGCTSGHGVCGLSRRSPRSLAAVATFMGVGFLTATLVGSLGGPP